MNFKKMLGLHAILRCTCSKFRGAYSSQAILIRRKWSLMAQWIETAIFIVRTQFDINQVRT
jgi:hypothetical protein